MPDIRTATRSVLRRRLSVADVLELHLWLAIPYVTVGVGWAFFHADRIRPLEDLLQTLLPAGGGMAAYLLVAGLWPVYVLVPTVCVA